MNKDEMFKNSVQWNIDYKPEEIQAESIKGLLMSQRWITFGRRLRCQRDPVAIRTSVLR